METVDLNASQNDWDEDVRKATLKGASRPPHLNRNNSDDDDAFPLPSPAASPMTSPFVSPAPQSSSLNAGSAATLRSKPTQSGAEPNATSAYHEVDADDAFGSDIQFGFGTDVSMMSSATANAKSTNSSKDTPASKSVAAGTEDPDEGYLQLGNVSAISAAGADNDDDYEDDDDYDADGDYSAVATATATETNDSLWDDTVSTPPTRVMTARRRAPGTASSPGSSRLGMSQPVASAAAAALMAEAKGGAVSSPLSRHAMHSTSVYNGFGADDGSGAGAGAGDEAGGASAVRQTLDTKLSNGQISESEYDQSMHATTAGSKFSRTNAHNASVYLGFGGADGDDGADGGVSIPTGGGVSRGREGSTYGGFRDASTPTTAGAEGTGMGTPLGFGIGTLEYSPSPSRANSAMSDYSGFGDTSVAGAELDIDDDTQRELLFVSTPSSRGQSGMVHIDEYVGGESSTSPVRAESESETVTRVEAEGIKKAEEEAAANAAVAEVAVRQAEDAERAHAEAEQVIKEKEEAAASIALQLAALAEEDANDAAAAEAEAVEIAQAEAERIIKEKEEAAAKIAEQLAALAAEEAAAEAAEMVRIEEEERAKKEAETAEKARKQAAHDKRAAIAAAAKAAERTLIETEKAAAAAAEAAAISAAEALEKLRLEDEELLGGEAAAEAKKISRIECTCRRFKCVCAAAGNSGGGDVDAAAVYTAAAEAAAAGNVDKLPAQSGRKSIVQIEMEATLAKEQQVEEERRLAAIERETVRMAADTDARERALEARLAAIEQREGAARAAGEASRLKLAEAEAAEDVARQVALKPKEEVKATFQREMEETTAREQEIKERAEAAHAARAKADTPSPSKVVATKPDPEAATKVKLAFKLEMDNTAAREKELTATARTPRASTLPAPRAAVQPHVIANDGAICFSDDDAAPEPSQATSPFTKKKKKWATVQTAAEKMAEDMAKIASEKATNGSVAPGSPPACAPSSTAEPELNATPKAPSHPATTAETTASAPPANVVKKWGKVQTAAEKMIEDMAKLATEKTVASSTTTAAAASTTLAPAPNVKAEGPSSATPVAKGVNPYAAKAAAAKARQESEAILSPKSAAEVDDVVPPMLKRRSSISDRLFPALSGSGSGADTDNGGGGGGGGGNAADSDDLEELDPRAIEAAAWTDKEIRKLIGEIKARGFTDDGGKHAITFGQLFDETDQIFDALSGILKTAKKYKVVSFDAEQLWQGQNDDTVILLLKEEHDGIEIKRRKKSSLVNIGGPPGRKGSSGFGGASLATQNAKCHVCEKTVYQVEFVGASDKAFHKNCFRCCTCNNKLSQNDYAVGHDRKFRCNAHHKEFEMSGL